MACPQTPAGSSKPSGGLDNQPSPTTTRSQGQPAGTDHHRDDQREKLEDARERLRGHRSRLSRPRATNSADAYVSAARVASID